MKNLVRELVALCTLTAVFSVGVTLNAQQSPETATIESFHGPVMGSNRLVGMGGAYVGVGQGAYAHFINPASLAVRYPYTKDKLLDWDFLVAWMSAYRNNQLKAVPEELSDATNSSQLLEGGANIKLHMFGAGAHGTSQQFSIPDTDINSWRTDAGMGLSLGHGTFQAGAMYQLAGLSMFDADSDSEIFSFGGRGYLLGILFSPESQHFRLGASLRQKISG